MVEKVGPFRVEFPTTIEVLEREELTRIKAQASGADNKVGSRMKIGLDVHLREQNNKTVLGFEASMDILGKLAALGHGIIKRKADQVLDEFTQAVSDWKEIREMLRRFRLEARRRQRSIELLDDSESAKVYPDGTELLLAMKEGLVQYGANQHQAVGLQVQLQNGTIRVGALCTHRWRPRGAAKGAVFGETGRTWPTFECAMGTIGGNLALPSHADPGTLLIALGAKMVAEKLQSARRGRLSLTPTRPVWRPTSTYGNSFRCVRRDPGCIP
jgi:hypothetical protein